MYKGLSLKCPPSKCVCAMQLCCKIGSLHEEPEMSPLIIFHINY